MFVCHHVLTLSREKKQRSVSCMEREKNGNKKEKMKELN